MSIFCGDEFNEEYLDEDAVQRRADREQAARERNARRPTPLSDEQFAAASADAREANFEKYEP